MTGETDRCFLGFTGLNLLIPSSAISSYLFIFNKRKHSFKVLIDDLSAVVCRGRWGNLPLGVMIKAIMMLHS